MLVSLRDPDYMNTQNNNPDDTCYSDALQMAIIVGVLGFCCILALHMMSTVMLLTATDKNVIPKTNRSFTNNRAAQHWIT